MRHSRYLASCAAIACVLGASAASGSVVLSWQEFSNVADAKNARSVLDTAGDVTVTEDFESFTPVPSGGGAGDFTPLPTDVGVFTTIEGLTCGGSCDAPTDQSLVRNTSSFGRYDTTSGQGNWIDSNDNSALVLTAGITGYTFDYLSFFLTDVDDVRHVPEFSIDVGSDTFNIALDEFNSQQQSNGDLFLVTLSFLNPVNTALITMNIDSGDGFGADDFGMGGIAPVPLPASVFLLLGAVGGLGYMGRRKKA